MPSATPGISIDESDQPPVVVVRLKEIPVAEQATLPRALDNLFEKGLRLFAVDFNGITYVTSPVIGSVVLLTKRAKDFAEHLEFRVALVGLERQIESVLTVVKLSMMADRCFFAANLQQALNALRGRDPDGPPPAGSRVPNPKEPPTRNGGAERDPPSDAA